MNCNSRITYDNDCNTVVHELNFDNDFVYVYVLQLNKTNELITNIAIKTTETEEVIFDLGLDGFYTLVTLKIPKDVEREYYYSNGKFYHFNEEIELETLVEINPNVSEFDIEHEYYFQTCRLRKCYINICKQIFDQVASIECNRPKLDPNLIYKRDLLWSAINVIEFMVERGEYKEAEILLERIMGCNGLCDSHCNKSHYKVPTPCNCGCL